MEDCTDLIHYMFSENKHISLTIFISTISKQSDIVHQDIKKGHTI